MPVDLIWNLFWSRCSVLRILSVSWSIPHRQQSLLEPHPSQIIGIRLFRPTLRTELAAVDFLVFLAIILFSKAATGHGAKKLLFLTIDLSHSI
jgi:hypothetical protein